MSKRRVGLENNIKFSRKRCKNIQNMICFFCIFLLWISTFAFARVGISNSFSVLLYSTFIHKYPAYKGFVLELLQIAKAEFENRQLGYFLITKKVATHYILSDYSLALVSHFYPTFLNKTKNVVSSKGDSITMAVYIPCPIWKKSTHIYLTRTY